MITDYLIQTWSETVCIVDDFDVDEVIILDVDTEVNSVKRFSKDDMPTSLEVSGRGGTAFEPAFDWVVETDEDPTILIYFTDMYGSFPMYEPDYPVIWVNYGGKDGSINCPFGEVINID
jgi:predicted metal-dependent peptidase